MGFRQRRDSELETAEPRYIPGMAELSRPQLERFLNAGNLESFIDAVAEHFPGTPGTPTRKAYVSSVRVYLRWAQEERRSVLNAAGDTAGAYVASLQAAGSSYSTQHNHATRIRTLYDLLVQAGAHPGPNPFAGLRLPSQKPEDQRLMYTPDELARLRAHGTAGERLMVLLGSVPGLTTTETLSLQWEHVDSRQGRLHVRGQWLPLDDELHAALREYARQRGHTDLFGASGPVFDVQGDSGLRRALFRLCKRANVPYKAWRALRNAAGWRLLQESGRADVVAERLGLSTLKAVEVWQKLLKKAEAQQESQPQSAAPGAAGEAAQQPEER